MRAWLALLLLASAGCGDESPAGMASSAGASGASGGSTQAGAGMSSGGQNDSAGSSAHAGASAGSSNMSGGSAGGGGVSCPQGDTDPEPWPGGAEVTTLDMPAWFNGNLSGLAYEPEAGASPAVLWAISNIPGRLYRL